MSLPPFPIPLQRSSPNNSSVSFRPYDLEGNCFSLTLKLILEKLLVLYNLAQTTRPR